MSMKTEDQTGLNMAKVRGLSIRSRAEKMDMGLT